MLKLHFDMNNYFASIEMLDKPELKNIPMVVCGDPKIRHGIVLSRNDLAKKLGIIAGESINSAHKKCPSLKLIIADYEKYLNFTKKARLIYQKYTDKVYPYGMDECWLEVDLDYNDAYKLALKIMNEIKDNLNLKVSSGISYNFIFAKLASDQKKMEPFVISEDNFKSIAWSMPAFNLLFVGSKTRTKLKNMGILTIGDLANYDELKIKSSLGKNGVMIQEFAKGNDTLFTPYLLNDEEIKSMGSSITLPKDINFYEDACDFLYVICHVLRKRLIKHQYKAQVVNLIIKDHNFIKYSKQKKLVHPSDDTKEIYLTVINLLNECFDFSTTIRSIGIRLSELVQSNYEQISLNIFDEDDLLERKIQALENKYGEISLNFNRGR